jgi:arylsulfatase A-like enzyme
MHGDYNYYPGYDGSLYSRMRIKELRARIPSLTSDDIEYIKAAYDSEIRFTDEHIGRLFDKLRELSLYEDTMIVFTADHGEEFLEKTNRIGHSTQVFQETIHVPLIIKLPGQNHRKNFESCTGLINLMPTIADYLEIPLECSYEISGESLNLSKKNIARTTVFSETYVESHSRAVFRKGWKLIEFPEERKLNLYHLKTDPGELHNVANTGEENQETTRRLLNLIRNWEQEMLVDARLRKSIEPKFTEEEIERLKALGYIK